MNGSDAFPTEPTQWQDSDFDGWGDNQTFGAALIDDFPQNPLRAYTAKMAEITRLTAHSNDDFPFVPSQYRDTDGDGYGAILQGSKVMFAFIPRQKKSSVDF